VGKRQRRREGQGRRSWRWEGRAGWAGQPECARCERAGRLQGERAGHQHALNLPEWEWRVRRLRRQVGEAVYGGEDTRLGRPGRGDANGGAGRAQAPPRAHQLCLVTTPRARGGAQAWKSLVAGAWSQRAPVRPTVRWIDDPPSPSCPGGVLRAPPTQNPAPALGGAGSWRGEARVTYPRALRSVFPGPISREDPGGDPLARSSPPTWPRSRPPLCAGGGGEDQRRRRFQGEPFASRSQWDLPLRRAGQRVYHPRLAERGGAPERHSHRPHW